MPCYKPLRAFKTMHGEVVFKEDGHDVCAQMSLPCGQCFGCRMERSRKWAVRCVHESQMHKRNSFVTLTYDDENLPPNGSLRHSDFQKFMKRARHKAEFRYYMCGEYGDETQRPHYHACLFGLDFDDRTKWRVGETGMPSYRSAFLESLWPHGHAECGDFDYAGAAYCARYVVQKMTGPLADQLYAATGRAAPYNAMSRRPGLGAKWFEQYADDCYNFDQVVLKDGTIAGKPPKYYDKLLEVVDPDRLADIKFLREQENFERREENTPERLAVREEVARARARTLKRGL